MNIQRLQTPYYTKSTKKMPPLGIIVHNTVTQALVAPHAQGSWHFSIDRNGDVRQYVAVDSAGIDFAWHVRACDEWHPDWMRQRDTRVSEANSCTVGIELVSYAGNTAGVPVPEPYASAQYTAIRELLAHLEAMYGSLPIVSHGSLQLDRTDPVAFAYDRAGLVWKGDGYRYVGGEDGEDMSIIDDLNGQVAALRSEVATRTDERDAAAAKVDELVSTNSALDQQRQALVLEVTSLKEAAASLAGAMATTARVLVTITSPNGRDQSWALPPD